MAAMKAGIVSPAEGNVASGVPLRCVGAAMGEMYHPVGQQLRSYEAVMKGAVCLGRSPALRRASAGGKDDLRHRDLGAAGM